MSHGRHVGPIIFSHPTPRVQLVDHGEVITFRESDRTTGETWWRASRTGGKQGDCTVSRICPVEPTPTDLAPYVEKSGFADLDAWLDAIADVNGSLPESGYLYRVTDHAYGRGP